METKGDKFEVRGRSAVFIGYSQGKKGYRIYDIKDRKFFVSRDVIFVEKEFLFKTPNSQQESTRNVESNFLNDTTHEDENLASLEDVGNCNGNLEHVQSQVDPTNEVPLNEDIGSENEGSAENFVPHV